MYEINITNSTETQEDIIFEYTKVTITNKTIEEIRTIRFCNSVQEVAEYVNKFANYLFNTKEFEGKLLRITYLGDDGLCTF